jgi:pSer/pThr/pTyr-binding forkhead associated (FHA) protein
MAQYFLVMQRGSEIGKLFDLNKRQFTIGRNPDNDLVLTDPLVSRYHSVIQPDKNGTFRIIDLNSTNGVLVNEGKLDPGIPQALVHHDMIFIGSSVFNIQTRSDDYQPHPPPPPRGQEQGATQTLTYSRLYS